MPKYPQSTWTATPAGWCPSYPAALTFPGDSGFAGGPWDDMASSFVLPLASVDPVHVTYSGMVGSLFIYLQIDQSTGATNFDANNGIGDIIYRTTWDCSGGQTLTYLNDDQGWGGDPGTIMCS